MEGLDYITHLMALYKWREKSYLDKDPPLDLVELMKNVYVKILEYEATLLDHMHRAPLKRWVKDISEAGDWSSRTASIKELDARCGKLIDAIAEDRALVWREEERRWQDGLLQQPREEQEKRNIRSLYSNYEASKNVNPERVAGTCNWLLSHTTFLAWRESQYSNILWLSADPGCGKSVLAKYLVDRKGEVLSANTQAPIICYFFFKDGDVDRADGAKAMCAVLHQLFLQQPHLYKYARDDFENKGEKFLADFDALWNIFIKASADASNKEVVCVLDALDKCREGSRKLLIDKLINFYRNLGPSKSATTILKFVVTSRPYLDIERAFQVLVDSLPQVRLTGEEESESISYEINLVIQFKVRELSKNLGLNLETQDHLQRKLSKNLHRTYLWLYLIFQEMESQTELSIDQLITTIETIPPTVDDAYAKILDKIKTKDRLRARKLFDLVLAAVRPLSLQEINVAMAVTENCHEYHKLGRWPTKSCQDTVKNICGLFLRVVDSKVYLIHHTARVYLTASVSLNTVFSPQAVSLGHWKQSFHPSLSNLVLAETCILFLQLQDFENRTLVGKNRDLDNEAILQYKKDYDFLSYASENWPAHFTQAHVTSESKLVSTVAENICNTRLYRFHLWFRIYWKEAEKDSSFPSGWTNLMVEAWFGHEKVIKLLLDKGADVNAQNGYYHNALQAALIERYKAVVKLLLDKGVDVNVQDGYYGNAL